LKTSESKGNVETDRDSSLSSISSSSNPVVNSTTLPSWHSLFDDEGDDITCDCGLGIRGHAGQRVDIERHSSPDHQMASENLIVDEVEEMEQRQRRGVNQNSWTDRPQHLREHNYSRQPLGDLNAHNQSQQEDFEFPSCQNLNDHEDDEYEDPDYDSSR